MAAASRLSPKVTRVRQPTGNAAANNRRNCLTDLVAWLAARENSSVLVCAHLHEPDRCSAADFVRYDKRPKAAHRYARTAHPIAIPQQTAPPQEAFASQPEKQNETPAAPSDCDLQLGKIAAFRQLAALIAPGECGAPDAVLLESVILPDQGKVAIAPPATLRCTMAEAVAQWIREDVAPAAAKLGAPPRELENMGSYECRGRNRVRRRDLERAWPR